MTTRTKATIEDLYAVPGNRKAEVVHGEIVLMSPTGAKPGRAAGNIYFSLKQHEQRTGSGYAFGDNVGFVVNLPDRKSFSPDAAWYTGNVDLMEFPQGAPVFAVEVRSKEDYGQKAEQKMAKKRQDYFAAGTLVVWDIDLLSEDTVRAYRSTDPDHPTIYWKGDLADAEPAVPGWKMLVDDILK